MIAALHLDNLLFLFLVLAAGLFRLLATKMGEAKNKSERSTSPFEQEAEEEERDERMPAAPPGTEEERIRKFLEALGQPTGSRPPPPIVRKRTIIPQVPAPAPNKIQPVPKQKTFQPVKAESPVFEVQPSGAAPEIPPPAIKTPAEPYVAVTKRKLESAPRDMDLITLLKSPSGLRNAMILREVFGPPRSMQDVDLVGSA